MPSRPIHASCSPPRWRADDQPGQGRAAPDPRETVVAGLAAAAGHGLGGPGVDPFTGRAAEPWDLVHALLDHAGKALDALGDAAVVARLLALLHTRGTGAERQRALWTRAGSSAEFVAALAAMTVPEPFPASWQRARSA